MAAHDRTRLTGPLWISLRRRLAAGAALVALAPVAWQWRAHSAQPAAAQPAAETSPPEANPAQVHAPALLPDRVILTWKEDPARTQAVTWRTSTRVARGVAQLAVADAGPKLSARARRFDAATTFVETNLGPAHYHSVEFTGLEPKTRYAYRVGDGVNWSEWHHFQTAADAAEPFTFIYFGDAQNDVKSLWSRVVREAFAQAPRARFMIHAGDLINRAENDAEWGEWFQAGGWVNGTLPSIPTPGNHEYLREGGSPLPSRLSRHWRPQFALPENGPAGLEETVYYLDYQGVRIVSLNSNVEQKRQAEWLEAVLSRNDTRWTIVTFHHPLFSVARNRDNGGLRAAWKPVLDRYRVDLVLQGHDHAYARSGLIGPANVVEGASALSQESGTVYVVSVSGPKMYGLERREFMRRAAEGTQLFQVISIDGPQLRYEARTATGELYDAFLLNKREGGPNELVDQIPNTPERRQSG